MTNTTTTKAPTVTTYHVLPHADSRCYACDAGATGVRDRRPEGGRVEIACDRHRDARIKVRPVCALCMGPMRKGGIEIDGEHHHAKCHREACGAGFVS